MSHFLEYKPIAEEEAIDRILKRVSKDFGRAFPSTKEAEFGADTDRTMINYETQRTDPNAVGKERAWKTERTLTVSEVTKENPQAAQSFPSMKSVFQKNPQAVFLWVCLSIFLTSLVFFLFL